MLRIGFIGWRGMVGSVLLKRMENEGDFQGIEPVFFSTSSIGAKAPTYACMKATLEDAHNLKILSHCDVLVTCQGGEYTSAIYEELRKFGWSGFWIDAASTLRMHEESVIVLDPVNHAVIDDALRKGIKIFVGGNCTVTLMLMAIAGLFSEGLVEWVNSMTYQAASGAGAKKMIELMQQMVVLADKAKPILQNPAASAVELERVVTETQNSSSFVTKEFGAALAGSLIPWVDRAFEDGQTREEWKAYVEANKILGTKVAIPIDGICVRVGTLRCHSQALCIKLKRNLRLDEIESVIAKAHPWVKVVPNTQEATLSELTPAAVSGSLEVKIGRIRKMKMGPQYLAAFTVGDQLLWGAAEPLRRMIGILRKYVE